VGQLAGAVLLAFFLGQVLASPAFAVAEVCSVSCPDDGPDGTCSPTCVDCGCCSHAGRSVIAPQGTPRPLAQAARCAQASAEPRLPAAFPEDVFHVPKPALA
jgi:hypothetical protein